MVHAALLLLMLEAANANLVSTISLKRSTQNLSYPQAAQPINPSKRTIRTLSGGGRLRQSLANSGRSRTGLIL
jgi:hypothetical protein